MITFTVFPNLKQDADQRANPYIRDFIGALNREGKSAVINPSHKNPLLSLLLPSRWGKVCIFNWFESIPDFKYGMLQSVIAVCFVSLLKLCGKKIVWILHNKRPHANGHEAMKRFLTAFIARRSDLILTHAEEGVELIREKYPSAAGKVCFFHHPTKNRLPQSLPLPSQMEYDLLIWGTISRYKGVLEYISYLRRHPDAKLRVCVVGKCPSDILRKELVQAAPPNVTLVFQSPSFEELGRYTARSRFVLVPYSPESVLSSGILMDSLSFGAKVIGPAVGSFKDYSREQRLNVYVFRSFDEIEYLFTRHKEDAVSLESYRAFLTENSWNNFAEQLITLVTNTLCRV